MAEKVLRIIDAQKQHCSSLRHHACSISGEETFYCILATMLTHFATDEKVATNEEQRVLYLQVCVKLLTQCAVSMHNRASANTAQAAAPLSTVLRPLIQGKNKKKGSKEVDDAVSDPMMEREAISLWQQNVHVRP